MSGLRDFSFYDSKTGLLHHTHFSTDDPRQLEANVPPGHLPIEGRHDHERRRVDLTTKIVVRHQPPAPSSAHVWNEHTERWDEPAATLAAQRAALQIMHLEQRQARAVREALLGDALALERLREIDVEITALRGRL